MSLFNEADFVREKRRKELETIGEKLKAERQDMQMALSRERDRLAETEQRAQQLIRQKAEMERHIEGILPDFGR